jgi:radical SAM-linked protein
MSTMQRSFRRAGISLKYSEGFNPHPYMSVALPLSVGYESSCELIDAALAEDVKPDIIKVKLPEGITLIDSYTPERKFNDIAWIEISGKLYYNNLVTQSIVDDLKNCLKRDSIIICKRTKRGHKDLDIAPYIKDVKFKRGDDVSFVAKISAQNPTINADDLVNALDDELKPDYISIRRVEIYDIGMIVFK